MRVEEMNQLFEQAIELSYQRGVAEEQIRVIKFLQDSTDINGNVDWHLDELLAALFGESK